MTYLYVEKCEIKENEINLNDYSMTFPGKVLFNIKYIPECVLCTKKREKKKHLIYSRMLYTECFRPTELCLRFMVYILNRIYVLELKVFINILNRETLIADYNLKAFRSSAYN